VGKTTAVENIAADLQQVMARPIVRITSKYTASDLPVKSSIIIVDDWVLSDPTTYVNLYNELPDSCLILMTSNLKVKLKTKLYYGIRTWGFIPYPLFYWRRVPDLSAYANLPGFPRRIGFCNYFINGVYFSHPPTGYAFPQLTTQLIPIGVLDPSTGLISRRNTSAPSVAAHLWTEYGRFISSHADSTTQYVQHLPNVPYDVECTFQSWDHVREILTCPTKIVSAIVSGTACVKIKHSLPDTVTRENWILPIDAINEAERGDPSAICSLLTSLRSFGTSGPVKFSVGDKCWVAIDNVVYIREVPHLEYTIHGDDIVITDSHSSITISIDFLSKIIASGAVNIPYPSFEWIQTIRSNESLFRQNVRINSAIDVVTCKIEERNMAEHVLRDSDKSKDLLTTALWAKRFVIVVGFFLALLTSIYLMRLVIGWASSPTAPSPLAVTAMDHSEYDEKEIYHVSELSSKHRKMLEEQARSFDRPDTINYSKAQLKFIGAKFKGRSNSNWRDQSSAVDQAATGLPPDPNNPLNLAQNHVISQYCLVSTAGGSVHGICYRTNEIVTVAHPFVNSNSPKATITYNNMQYEAVVFDISVSRDIARLKITSPHWKAVKDITGFFVKAADNSHSMPSHFVQIECGKGVVYDCESYINPACVVTGLSAKRDVYASDFYHAQGLPVRNGSCGFAYLATDPCFNSRRIFAIHCGASSSRGLAYSARVTQEMLLSTFMAEDQAILPTLKEAGPFHFTDKMLEIIKSPRCPTYKNIKPLFSSAKTHNPIFFKSKFRLSRWATKLRTSCKSKPTISRAKNVPEPENLIIKADGQPCVHGTQLAKYFGPQPVLDETILSQALVLLTDHFKSHYTKELFKPCSLYEALNGDLHDESLSPYVDSIDINTHSGFYATHVLGKSRKSQIINRCGLGFLKIIDPDFRAIYDIADILASQGKRLCLPFLACLKSELLPFKKVEEGGTRLFCAGDSTDFIVNRRIFLPLAATLHKGRSGSPLKIGVDPISEFSECREELTKVAAYGIEGDFSRYDKHLPRAITAAVFQFFKNIYQPAYHNYIDYAELTFADALVLVDNDIYQLPRGNPSGHYLTCIVNSFCHLLINFYVLLKNNIEINFKQMAFLIHGDDGIVVFSEALRKKISPTLFASTIAEMGMTYKITSNEYQPLDNLKFLKRSLALVNGCGRIVLPSLERDSITRTLHFSSTYAVHDIANRLNNALFEASLHDEKLYDEVYKDVVTIIAFMKNEFISKTVILTPFLTRHSLAWNIANGTSTARIPPFSIGNSSSENVEPFYLVIEDNHPLSPSYLEEHNIDPHSSDLFELLKEFTDDRFLTALSSTPEYKLILPYRYERDFSTSYTSVLRQLWQFHAMISLKETSDTTTSVDTYASLFGHEFEDNFSALVVNDENSIMENNRSKLNNHCQVTNTSFTKEITGVPTPGDPDTQLWKCVVTVCNPANTFKVESIGLNKANAYELAATEAIQILIPPVQPVSLNLDILSEIIIKFNCETLCWDLCLPTSTVSFNSLGDAQAYVDNSMSALPTSSSTLVGSAVDQADTEATSLSLPSMGGSDLFPIAAPLVLNPLGPPNMLSMGGLIQDLKDVVYNNWMPIPSSPLTISASSTAGTELASIPYGPAGFTSFMQAYFAFHNAWAGTVEYKLSLSTSTLYFGRAVVGWVPDASKTYTVEQLMAYGYYVELDFSGRKDVHFLLSDTRQNGFFRTRGDTTPVPGIKVLMMTSLSTSIGNDTALAQLIIISKFCEDFQMAQPAGVSTPSLSYFSSSQDSIGSYGINVLKIGGKRLGSSTSVRQVENFVLNFVLGADEPEFNSPHLVARSETLQYRVISHDTSSRTPTEDLIPSPGAADKFYNSSSINKISIIKADGTLIESDIVLNNSISGLIHVASRFHKGWQTRNSVLLDLDARTVIRTFLDANPNFQPGSVRMYPAIPPLAGPGDETADRLPNGWSRIIRNELDITASQFNVDTGHQVQLDSWLRDGPWARLQSRVTSIQGAIAADVHFKTPLSIGDEIVLRYNIGPDEWYINLGDHDPRLDYSISNFAPSDLYVSAIHPRKANEALLQSTVTEWTSYAANPANNIPLPDVPVITKTMCGPPSTCGIDPISDDEFEILPSSASGDGEDHAAAIVAGGAISGFGKSLGAAGHLWWQGLQNDKDRVLAKTMADINANASIGTAKIHAQGNIASSLVGAVGRTAAANIARNGALQLSDRNAANKILVDGLGNNAASRNLAMSHAKNSNNAPNVSLSTKNTGTKPKQPTNFSASTSGPSSPPTTSVGTQTIVSPNAVGSGGKSVFATPSAAAQSDMALSEPPDGTEGEFPSLQASAQAWNPASHKRS
jgi:hypothetical protein